MGILGRPSELIELKSVLRDLIPVIRRFTGGGTVIVDSGTIFTMLICNKDVVPGARDHVELLCRMEESLQSRSTFIERTIASLECNFSLRHIPAEAIFGLSDASFSPSTKLLKELELEEAFSSQCETFR